MVLNGPKLCCMIRAYRCAALDTPLAYIRKKIDPRPPGAQERAIWPLGGPFSGHRLGFWPENPFFCYCTPDFVNSPFVTLDDIFDFAPLHRFLVAVRLLSGPFSGHRAGFWPENPFFAIGPRIFQWPVCNPRRYLRFGTFGSIFSGRSAARRAVFWPPGRILARKSVFCYRTPNFVNGPFVTLCETVDLAPLDRFLKFSFPSYGPKWPKMA